MARAISKTGRFTVVIAAGALSMGLFAACSSSSSGGSNGSSGSSPSAPAFNEATAKNQIATTWNDFFDPTKPEASKLALLEDSANLKPILDAQANNPQAKSTKASVKNVVIDPSHTTATVTYDLVPAAGGAPLLAGSTGKAVLDNGTWKVSKATFCTLIGLAGTTPPQCTS